MKKFYKNLKHIVKVLEKRYPEFLYYKDDIYEIINLYLGNSHNTYNDEDGYTYISEAEFVGLVRGFLSNFDCDYVEKFDRVDKLMLQREEIVELLEHGDIDNFMKRRLQVTLTNDGVVYFDVKTGKCYISILKENRIKDAFSLLHEFIHSISHSAGNLAEIQSILSELVFSKYLEDIGYNRDELDKYFKERINLLAPTGYFIDLCFTLKLIDIFREYGFVTKEILNMDDEQFNNLVKRYEDSTNIDSFVKNLESIDFKHLIGLYKALNIYESMDKNRLYSVFTELNGVGLWLDEIEFNNYIDMVIKDESKRKIRKNN